ncbi:DUF1788 domain-containing protein [Lactobacillus sp. LC28-10]|uniref:DUF1788 domain-containing protein n=1 Tax=Secundilactobacillus angelensis TaxID=2722706 RepID=A0ABX1KVS6_9LACO|nr:DUF1788 domain-containing protein [Secundilactobacillus angelensis]MCH5461947.1 DUF1788 domain-containing protein [Secundilactobacillus angelensis]NLR17435.1 DUF1788 domain-containing protein [Secundilactobacillus angelensis]
MSDLDNDFKRLEQKIGQKEFQQNRGLSNEVGYYIFDYRPEDELRVREYVKNIANRSTVATIGANVKIFNLYDLMMEILDDFGYTAGFEDLEKNFGMTHVIEEVNNILEMNEEHNLIVKRIESQLSDDEPTIIFITGVGEVFPLLRSHKVLNTMNQVIDQSPVIMFYPGKYDGLHLRMFGELEDDNYYRAFSLRMEWNERED